MENSIFAISAITYSTFAHSETLRFPIENVRVLLENGANVNNLTDSGGSILNFPLNESNEELVELLIDFGAIPDKLSLSIVKKCKNRKIIRHIRRALVLKNGPITKYNKGYLTIFAKSNLIWDKIYNRAKANAFFARTKRKYQIKDGIKPTQNQLLYALGQLHGAGLFLWLPILFLALIPTIILIIANGFSLIFIAVGLALALLFYSFARGLSLFVSPIILASIIYFIAAAETSEPVKEPQNEPDKVALVQDTTKHTNSQKPLKKVTDVQTKNVKPSVKSPVKSQKDLEIEKMLQTVDQLVELQQKFDTKNFLENSQVAKNPLIANWDPIVDDYDEYEPYLLKFAEDGTYTIVAEDEANNITGKWRKHNNSTYRFADKAAMLTGFGQIITKNGKTELVINHNGGLISRYSLQSQP